MDIDRLNGGESAAVEQRLMNEADLFALDGAVCGLELCREESAEPASEHPGGKRPSVAAVIGALGIRGVGNTIAGAAGEHYHSLDELAAATVGSADDRGPRAPRSALIEWFANERNRNDRSFGWRCSTGGTPPVGDRLEPPGRADLRADGDVAHAKEKGGFDW